MHIFHVMSAVVLEFRHAETQLLHRFCAQNVHVVLQTSLFMLAILHVNLPACLNRAALRNARAVLTFLQAWKAYSSDPAVLPTVIAIRLYMHLYWSHH